MQLVLPYQHANTGCICTSSLFAAQIQPDREIITEYIKNDEFKYVRILGDLPVHCLEGTKLHLLLELACCMESLLPGCFENVCRRPCACDCNCCSKDDVGGCVSSHLPQLSPRPTGVTAMLLELLQLLSNSVLPAICRSLLPAAGGPPHRDLQLLGTSVQRLPQA